jgi:hypothetical protein
VAVSCDCGNERSSSIKSGEFLDYLRSFSEITLLQISQLVNQSELELTGSHCDFKMVVIILTQIFSNRKDKGADRSHKKTRKKT